LAKIAVPVAHPIARGPGWDVRDVVCTGGPQDRPYEERHTDYTIAIVLAGSFQYRTQAGRALMSPGSLLLGNDGHCFECGHEHADGDRCLSFSYAPAYFERLAAEALPRGRGRRFTVPRLPPLRPLSPLVARAGLGIAGAARVPWDEIALTLAVRTLALSAGASPDRARLPLNAEARVTQAVRTIDRAPAAPLTLDAMAAQARLSPYHFLRTFERLTGVTPHQYVVRARLRHAAIRLAAGTDRVLDVALDSGFGDVSNFNRAFRAEFGVSPRAFRRSFTE
jgi:AraC family transcriptional regulator